MKDKKVRKYIILLVLLFAVMVFVETNRKQPVSWLPTFINTDKNPYGTYILFDLLKDVFPEDKIRVSRFPITNELKYIEQEEEIWAESYEEYINPGNKFTNTSYLFITNSFGVQRIDFFNNSTHQAYPVDKLDIDNLLRFAEEGNNVFIAAESFTSILLDSLEIGVKNVWSGNDTTYVLKDFGNKEYTFSPIRQEQYFFEKDSSSLPIKVLAESKENKRPVFLKVSFGKGYFYLNSLPAAFSNLHLLQDNKYEFAFICLSYLPGTDIVIWDEYLKQGRIGENSSFRVIWNHPALLYAYYIALAMAVLFIFFRSKRNQRIIPVIEPPKNTSVEFVETISNLYYQKQAYESIVEKRHAYFLEKIRSRYYLGTENIDAEFTEILSLKSGVSKNVIEDIFGFYAAIQQQYYISDTLLLKYNESLERFYREMK